MEGKVRTCWKWTLLTGLLLLIAILLFITGLLLNFSIPSIIESNIRQESQLVEGSRLWKKWMNPNYKMQMKVWTYSVRNPDEILRGDIPEVRSMGPYAYDIVHKKEVLNVANGTVKYRRAQTYHFNEKDSCPECFLGNRVWLVNILYQKFIEAASIGGLKAATTTLLTQTAFLEVEVDELLFRGYKDPFLDQICALPFMNLVCSNLLQLPERIGLFYGKNGSTDGIFEVENGVEEPIRLGRIVSWNGKKEVPSSWWTTREARAINGSDGTLFRPLIQKTDKLEVFVTQLCRSIYLVFEKEVTVRGVSAYRFMMPAEVLDPTRDENKGFCNPTEKVFFNSQKDTKCLPKGLIEISRCEAGEPPVVISLPNFLFADEEVRKSVKGLEEPDLERDLITVDVEPRLGVVLAAKRRSQVNIEMWKGKEIRFPVNLERLRSSLIPVLLIHEDVEIDDETLGIVNDELLMKESLGYSSAKVLMGSSIILILVAISLLILKTFLHSFFLRRRGEAVSPSDKTTPVILQRTVM